MPSFGWYTPPILFLLALGCTTPVPPGSTIASSAIHEVESQAAAAYEERHLPGLALAILQGDEVLLAKGYGYVGSGEDLAPAGQVDGRTVFQLGSISKQFLAALVLSMVEEGRLSLYDAGVTIVVLANRGDVRTESIERPMARRLLELPPPILREEPLSEERKQRYLGTYDIGVFNVRVLERDGRVWLEAPRPGPTAALTYISENEFAGDVDPEAYHLTFGSEGGRAETLRLLMGGMHWYGSRRPEPGASLE